jgi:predicted DNA-binding transcriptional regulator AlpA
VTPYGEPQEAPEAEAFVGVHEVASLTGYQPDTIRKLCQRDAIPHHQARRGAALLFLVSEIQAWLRGET